MSRLLILLFLIYLATPTKLTAQTENTDSDGDKLWDHEEIKWGTDPHNPDSDGDGYKDKVEIINGYDPLGSGRFPKWIRIDLSEQSLSYGYGPKAVDTFIVSTGKRGFKTPTGTFAVLYKTPKKWSAMYKLWMPYWMAFTYQGHGIHELPYWPNGYREGANHLGIPVSHGCVRLGIGPAQKLYDWAEAGTKIVVME